LTEGTVVKPFQGATPAEERSGSPLEMMSLELEPLPDATLNPCKIATTSPSTAAAHW
jgi:hypothetical protein